MSKQYILVLTEESVSDLIKVCPTLTFAEVNAIYSPETNSMILHTPFVPPKMPENEIQPAEQAVKDLLVE